MVPVNYVTGLDEMYQGMGFPPYKWSQFDSSPWTPFKSPPMIIPRFPGSAVY
jgi:hypothetical protein